MIRQNSMRVQDLKYKIIIILILTVACHADWYGYSDLDMQGYDIKNFGTIAADHNELINLAWSVAGHTMDADLVFSITDTKLDLSAVTVTGDFKNILRTNLRCIDTDFAANICSGFIASTTTDDNWLALAGNDSTAPLIRLGVDNDPRARWAIDASGLMAWGLRDTGGAFDVFLGRTVASRLDLTGSLLVSVDITASNNIVATNNIISSTGGIASTLGLVSAGSFVSAKTFVRVADSSTAAAPAIRIHNDSGIDNGLYGTHGVDIGLTFGGSVLEYTPTTWNFQTHNIGNVGILGAGATTLDSLVVDTTTLVVNAVSYEDRVGIGTATPESPLHVAKEMSDHTPLVLLENLGTNSGEGDVLDVYTRRADGFTDGYIAQFRNVAGTKVYIRGDGNVGIGTTEPTSKLHIFSPDAQDSWNQAHIALVTISNLDMNADQSEALLVRGGADNALTQVFEVQDYSGNADFTVWGDGEITMSGNVGIGLTAVDDNYKLIIRRAANINLGIGLQETELAIAAFNDALSANIPMRFYASEYNLLNGNVGINVTDPDAKLEIVGTLHVSDAATFDGTLGAGATTVDSLEITNNNIIFVGISNNIETAIAAATAGDVIILASGTYTVSDDIDIAQSITVIGQGRGVTIIDCDTANKNIFHVTVSDVTIQDLSVTSSVNGALTGIYFDGVTTADITSGLIENVDVIFASSTGVKVMIDSDDASYEIRNCRLDGISSDTDIEGLVCLSNNTSNQVHTVNVYDTDITTEGNATGNSCYHCADNSSTNDIILNLYNCRGKATGASTKMSAVIASNPDALLFAENCIFEGDTWDAENSDSASIQLRDCVLVNALTLGTITHDGQNVTGSLNAGSGLIQTTGNVDLNSNANKLRIGDDQELELYHDGTDSFISNLVGELNIINADKGDGTGSNADFIRMLGGAGGSKTGVGTAGRGSSFSLQSGTGGASSGDGFIKVGGAGGGFTLLAKDGGDVTGTAGLSNAGGAGGAFTLTSGDGGDAAGGTANTGGDGGDIDINPGAGGTGATANGADGVVNIGDGTNETRISRTGDLFFVGTAGFIMGHMDVPATNVITVATQGTANPVEVKDDGTVSANDGWESTYQNGTTFAASDLHYITVTIAGTYKVVWDMSPATAAGAGTLIHGGITIDTTTFVRDNGEGHAHVFNANDNIQINGVGIIDCPNGTEEISLWISNDQNQKTEIEHGNMNIQLIAGT